MVEGEYRVVRNVVNPSGFYCPFFLKDGLVWQAGTIVNVLPMRGIQLGRIRFLDGSFVYWGQRGKPGNELIAALEFVKEEKYPEYVKEEGGAAKRWAAEHSGKKWTSKGEKALAVIALTPQIYEFLEREDPQALKQVQEALGF